MKLLKEYQRIHRENKNYGAGDPRIAVELSLIVSDIGADNIRRALDYGCGKSLLIYEVGLDQEKTQIERFDPAIEAVSKKAWDNEKILRTGPIFNLTICNDVLEHIPQDEIDEVLNEIKNISERVFFTIHCALASAKLSDGSNAHVNIKSPEEWQEYLSKFWSQIKVISKFGDKVSLICS